MGSMPVPHASLPHGGTPPVAAADSGTGIARPSLVRTPDAQLPTRFGEFTVCGFGTGAGGEEHLAIWKGNVTGEDVLARVHSSCLTGDVLGSARCDCGEQLQEALNRIAKEGRGVLIYLQQEGRGIGLVNKLRAYALQDAGANTVEANEQLGFPADARDYALAAHMLKSLRVRSVRLLTNNPAKVNALARAGVRVVERVALDVGANPWNRAYLDAKKRLMGHLL